jgi:DNA-binding response OmpR family regulator
MLNFTPYPTARRGEVISTLANVRVLIVEDETLLAMDLQMTLEQNGCSVIGPVATVAAAIRLIEDAVPDAALLDLNLNGESSVPIADVLVERWIPFVFVTGYDRSHLPDRHRDAQIVAKPYIPDHVVQLLRGAIVRSV